ncbi:Receptor like protein 27 [Theobroma cacao]|uniref:Receptor like protein 27 n=1 Tax=Theobroma cacao TaxID=3641 RepID=A0A061F932_THECC|nr:Receptor like protein 27 [Theobroma cacao]
MGEISGVCNMKFLEILDLSHNNFSGIIPQCIGSFSKSLSLLNLKKNKFHGIVPPTFARGCGLKNLNLNSNHLEGPLTRSISNCKDLEVLDLGNNKIKDTFPHWIVALSELQVLVLHSNKFQGSIGASKNPQSLPKLRIIDLSQNNFFGPLPTSYMKHFKGMMKLDEGKAVRYMGERNYSYDYSVAVVVKGLEIELVKILTIFTTIDLSGNNFEGEIPRVIGELSSLRGLNLSHNNLVGHVPPSLGNLSQLEWLDLSSNKLDGQIPRELVDLTFLSFFNVSNNQLVGPIPQGKQFNTFENDSYEGNKGLCGLPLSIACSSNEPRQPPPSMNSHNEDGSKFEFGWEVVLIGYGFGFIFGVSMGYVAFRARKPKWFVTLVEGCWDFLLFDVWKGLGRGDVMFLGRVLLACMLELFLYPGMVIGYMMTKVCYTPNRKFEKSLKDDIAPNGIIKSIKPRTSSNRNFKVKLRVSQFKDDSKWSTLEDPRVPSSNSSFGGLDYILFAILCYWNFYGSGGILNGHCSGGGFRGLPMRGARGDSDSDISQSVSEGPTDFTAESRWCLELNNLEGDPFRVPTNWAPSDLGTKVKIRESPSDSETDESVDKADAKPCGVSIGIRGNECLSGRRGGCHGLDGSSGS